VWAAVSLTGVTRANTCTDTAVQSVGEQAIDRRSESTRDLVLPLNRLTAAEPQMGATGQEMVASRSWIAYGQLCIHRWYPSFEKSAVFAATG
jgi:hypothetical protein